MTDHSMMSSRDFMPRVERDLGGYVPALKRETSRFSRKERRKNVRKPERTGPPPSKPLLQSCRADAPAHEGAPTAAGNTARTKSEGMRIADIRTLLFPPSPTQNAIDGQSVPNRLQR